MTIGLKNRENNGLEPKVLRRRVSLFSLGAGILIILFMGNLNALIDAVIHPEIHYLDKEHLIVGGITTIVTTLLITIVLNFFFRLIQKETELQKLNAELEKKVDERTRQLVDAQEKLLRTEKLAMLGQIAGNMGNELRNPLGVMSNAVFFLQTVMPDADENVREYLEIIGKEIDISKNIISDLTDFCQGRSPRIEPVAVHNLIRQSREKCSIPKNIGFQSDLPETLPKILADPLQMVQVFQNLIANAIQAMPEGGELDITTRRVDDFVEISVTDTGTGISPENMEKLFQPFFTTKSRGIGLGLAISQKFVEANGGRIEVESTPGEGSTFTLLLPIQKEIR